MDKTPGYSGQTAKTVPVEDKRDTRLPSSTSVIKDGPKEGTMFWTSNNFHREETSLAKIRTFSKLFRISLSSKLDQIILPSYYLAHNEHDSFLFILSPSF